MAHDIEIRGFVAQGAQGSVQLVYDRAQRRFLALKLVRLGDEESLSRFLTAARATASGEADPWVISCDDSGDASDAPPAVREEMSKLEGLHAWLLLRYVHGPNLLELSSGDASFSWAEVAATGALVAQRLAHRPEGRAHLDLKPENVLVDREGRIFLADAHTDGTSGTPAYAAPEQLAPGATPGPQADLFALGRILLRLAARTFPKEGDPPGKLPPWPEVPEEMPAERRRLARRIMSLSMKLCSLEPGERGTIDEAARTLLECAVGLGDIDPTIVVRASLARATLPERIERLAGELAHEPEPRRPRPLAGRRWGVKRLVPLAAIAALLTGLGTLGFTLRHVRTHVAPPAPRVVVHGAIPTFSRDVHHTAKVTQLEDDQPADATHGFFGIVVRGRVAAVAIQTLAYQTLWRDPLAVGYYRLDLAPGHYYFVQEREVNDTETIPHEMDREEIEIKPGESLVKFTTEAPLHAPAD